jgi:hypothetical protein
MTSLHHRIDGQQAAGTRSRQPCHRKRDPGCDGLRYPWGGPSGPQSHRGTGWSVLRSAPGRLLLVRLTRRGRELVDRLAQAHLDNERDLLSGFSRGKQEQLAMLLRDLLATVEQRYPAPGSRDRRRR